MAAGLVPIAHANDGGGSIRIPAAANGVFGFKPTRGRTVSAIVGRSDFGDITSDGCVSRSVRDTARLLSLVEDDGSAYRLGFVAGPEKRRLRIGAWSRTFDGREPDAEIRRAHDATLALCRELGHEIVEVQAPVFDTGPLGDAFFIVAGAAVAGLVAMVGGMRGKPVGDDELEPFSWALARRANAGGPSALAAAREAFATAARAYLEVSQPYDAICTPVIATQTWRLGHLSPLVPADELIRRTAEAVSYTPIQNIAGAPAMSVPLHAATDGMPIGSHFAAKPGDDAILLALAYELEAARPWADRWPPFSIPMLAH